MTEYDYSPEAAEAFQRKLRGVGKWAQNTSRYNGDFTNPFEHTPSAARRRLERDYSSSSGSDSDSDSGITSLSRRRPAYPKSLTVWPGSHPRVPPRPIYIPPPPPPPPPPALAQRPPPTRSNTAPHQIYAQQIPQAPQAYPYPTQPPMGYYPAQQQVSMPQQQQSYGSTPYYAPPAPQRSNTTPSKPVIPNGYPYVGTPANSPVTSPYATPVQSPYGSVAYHQPISGPTSPRATSGSKGWLSRMFGALSIRGRSSSPVPTSTGSGGGQVYYDPQPASASRHPRSRSLEPTGYRSPDRRERDGYRSDYGQSTKPRRSKSTRTAGSSSTTKHQHSSHRHSDDSDRDRHGRRRHTDRSREMHHRRSRSHFR
ncbi:hypothetical protein VKT23_012360 [Stygiomarasmius scandens]|uniref:Uncharacterized protein n=1 Tax=Marasmiellus scandens TaxID=2682957 RepID=A0ABR1J8H9_9AGAR